MQAQRDASGTYTSAATHHLSSEFAFRQQRVHETAPGALAQKQSSRRVCDLAFAFRARSRSARCFPPPCL